MKAIGFAATLLMILHFTGCGADELRISDELPLSLPKPGACQLRVLAPTLLELTLITTKKPEPARVEQWDFVSDSEKAQLPGPQEFAVSAAGQKIAVKSIGF